MTDVTKLIEDLERAALTGPDTELLLRARDMLRALTAPKDGVGRGEIPYKVIAELYTSTLQKWLPPAKGMPRMRQIAIAARWKEDPERQTIAWWADFWKTVAASDFLCGRSTGYGQHENWRANFDWFLKPLNMAKVVEGNYTNKGPTTNVQSISRFR